MSVIGFNGSNSLTMKGATSIFASWGYEPVDTYMDIWLMDNNDQGITLVSGASVGLATSFVADVSSAIENTGGFWYQARMYACRGSDCRSISQFFDAYNTDPAAQSQTSFSGGFFYEAPAVSAPASIALLSLGLLAFATRRRKLL